MQLTLRGMIVVIHVGILKIILMQTTRTRRGSSFQERDSEGRFANRSRRNRNDYENDYDEDRFSNRRSRYGEDDFDEGRYGRSSRYQGNEENYDEGYPQNRGRRAYDNSAEYDDEDYDYNVDRYNENRYNENEDEDYGTRGLYNREQRWGRRDISSMNRGEYRNQPRGMHYSGWDERHYGNTAGRGGYERFGGYDEDYPRGRAYGSDMYESNLYRSSGRSRGFASMPRDEVRQIASMGGRASARSRSSRGSRSNRSRSRR
jgi:hypothetical protein